MDLWPFIQSFLDQSEWQGVAGIAQIFAGLFAVVTIIQSKKMMDKAEEQRRDSADPDWEFVQPEGRHPDDPGSSKNFVGLTFYNSGDGPARNIRCPHKEDVLLCAKPHFLDHSLSADLKPKTVLPGGVFKVYIHELDMNHLIPKVDFSIESYSRFGNRLVHEFTARPLIEDGFLTCRISTGRVLRNGKKIK